LVFSQSLDVYEASMYAFLCPPPLGALVHNISFLFCDMSFFTLFLERNCKVGPRQVPGVPSFWFLPIPCWNPDLLCPPLLVCPGPPTLRNHTGHLRFFPFPHCPVFFHLSLCPWDFFAGTHETSSLPPPQKTLQSTVVVTGSIFRFLVLFFGCLDFFCF